MLLFQIISLINLIIALLFVVCYCLQIIYIFVPYFKKAKPHGESKLHRYAVLICARDESAVIGNLIDSIKAQDYPAELISIFVAADNCTDNTAEICRNLGATVYERFDTENIGKGYAMDFMLKNIEKDFGKGWFDAFLVLDADNLVEKNYITEMNKTFSDGYRIITSYRNSKNFGDNWISSGYAFWFLHDAQYLNRSRFLMGTSCSVMGTGFMFSKEVLADLGGWPFYMLIEDIQFTVDRVLKGEKIGYCETAVFYDEQPTKFSQGWRQRMRWVKGYMQVFSTYGGRLIKGIFSKNGLACYDMTMSIMPAITLSIILTFANSLALAIGIVFTNYWIYILISFLGIMIGGYLLMLFVAATVLFTEWNMIKASTFKKIFYAITFPFYMMTYIPITIAAQFVKVTWKPIEHKVAKTLEEITKK